MPRPGAGRRYAEAAFELAERDGTIDAWQKDLAAACELAQDERVARDIEWRNYDYLVFAQVRGLGENEVHADVQAIERPIEAPQLQFVPPWATPRHVARRLPLQERHVLGSAPRIVTVEQGDRMRRL